MAIEQRKNNSVALTCDTADCHMEILGVTEEEALEDAQLIGWLVQQGKYICRDCQRGKNTAAVAAYGTDRLSAGPAPVAYSKGDPVYAPDGTQVGRAAHDVAAGEDLVVDLMSPEQTAASHAQPVEDDAVDITDSIASLADCTDEEIEKVFGSEPNDDAKLRLPRDEPKPKSLRQPHGDTLPGVTASRATIKQRKAELEREREKAQRNAQARRAQREKLFGEIDAMLSSSTWDPDSGANNDD